MGVALMVVGVALGWVLHATLRRYTATHGMVAAYAYQEENARLRGDIRYLLGVLVRRMDADQVRL